MMRNDVVAKLDSLLSCFRSPSKRYARRTIAGTSRDQILEEKPVQGPPKDNKPFLSSSHSQPLHSSINRINTNNPIVSNGGNNVTIVHVNSSDANHTQNGFLALNHSHSANIPSSNTQTLHRKSLINTQHSSSNGTLIPAVIPPSSLFNQQHSTKRNSPGSEATKLDDDGGFREGGPRSLANSKFASNHVRLDSIDNGVSHPVNGLSYRVMPERIHDSVEVSSSLPASSSSSSTIVQQLNGNGNSRGSLSHSRKDIPIPSPLEHVANGSYASGLVLIKIKPDLDGKFGFNVRGGYDLNLPVIVTRVAPNTPADLAVPRLSPGDEVVSINGRETSLLNHDEVVRLIKASNQNRNGELILHVKPSVYNGGEQVEEPEFQFIPDHPRVSGSSGSSPLQESMMLLSESLKTATAIVQFDQLYKRNPKMSMKDAEILANNARNRYKDVLPYDSTRVFLHSLSGNDYINANYIKMEIPTSGIVNRYIAAQGPLPHTSLDFWQMVWEQQSTLIVMLTSLIEQGRIKCHQYWPKLYETAEFGRLQITCVKEQVLECFAFRELTLIHMETNEERHITHMQYIAWPDHGVPDDASDFLEFVIRVRQHRVGMNEPTVIHCSAGIGRTGVLILMETAMCLVEANEPVYPLDIVRCMRDQRAMLIQTASQYKFVCEAILRVYNDGLVKPLDDYRR